MMTGVNHKLRKSKLLNKLVTLMGAKDGIINQIKQFK